MKSEPGWSADRSPVNSAPKMGRRELLIPGAAAGMALMGGCKSIEQQLTHPTLAADALELPPESDSSELRLLNRIAYGPRPGELKRVEAMGRRAYVEEQLHPDGIDEDPAAYWRVRGLGDSLNSDTGLLFDQDDHRLVNALRQATILRAVYSRRQLQERMTEFWSDHFNIYAFKGQGPQLKIVDDLNTIRPHVLGNFRDLLGASARSAAMLGYLDNTVNRKGVPNENYARELMELHTLGVDGGYTQKDVKEVARCLTGWTAQKHWRRGQFLFDPDAHDDGAKKVLGHLIPAGGGQRDGERVLDILAAHPSTARHLARKWLISFTGTAPEAAIQKVARAYLEHKGEIRPPIREILLSDALYRSPPILKRPFDYVVSALRALNVDSDGGPPLQAHLEKMGQPLFAWPRPDGFPTAAAAWTGTLIPRWNFALELASDRIQQTAAPWPELADRALNAGLTVNQLHLQLISGSHHESPRNRRLALLAEQHPDPREFTAIALMSPEFQWR